MPERAPEEIEGEELLVLILRVYKIKKSAAIRSLGVDESTVDDWISALMEAGWIKPIDTDLDDPPLEISETTFEKINDIRKGVVFKELVKEKKKKKKAIRSPVKIDKIVMLDILIVLTTIASILLVYKFVMDPDKESLSFIIAMALFSVVILIYKAYSKVSRTRKFFSVIGLIFRNLIHILTKRKKHIFAVFTILILFYFAGRFVVTKKIYFIPLVVLSMTTFLLTYLPKQTRGANLRFYMGILLLTFALLLLGGLYKPVDSRFLNVSAAIISLILLQVKESSFGVGIKSFKEMADRF